MSSSSPLGKRTREEALLHHHHSREAEEEQQNHARKRPLVVSCHESQSPLDAEESPVLRDDTVILSKSSLDSTKSYEWFSSQVSTPVPAEPASTISIDQIPTPAPPNLESSVAYLPDDPHRHANLSQQQQTQQHHSFQSSPHDAYTHQEHTTTAYPTYPAAPPTRHHPHQYSNRQLPYVDYTPYREPYIPPNNVPVQHHYSYEENVTYCHPPPPPPSASYYSYPYPAPQEYNYYHAYYPSDPRLYNTGVAPSGYSMKADTMPSHMAPHRPPDDPRTAGIPLYLPCDESTLSAYQCMVRQQIEFFAASPSDVEQTIQGRNKKIEPGQVGIRCRHCKHIPVKRRARGAMYYPSKLSCIYQMAQNMASVHINQACEYVPAYIRENLIQSVSDRKSLAGSGKEYWATGARSLGVMETDGRLMFANK